MNNTKQAIIQYANKYNKLASSIFQEPLEPIELGFYTHRSKVIGRAYVNYWKLRFNLPLLYLHPESVEEIVAHEVAHLFAIKKDDLGHGDEWKYIMKCFGHEPLTVYNLSGGEVTTKNPKTYLWQCPVSKKTFHACREDHARFLEEPLYHIPYKTHLEFVRELTRNELIEELVKKEIVSEKALDLRE